MRGSIWMSVIMAGMFIVAVAALAAPPRQPLEPELSGSTASAVERDASVLRSDHENRHYCSATAKSLLRACKASIQDDYWTAFAACQNIANAHDRETCMEEAKQALEDAESECRDQYEARAEACDQLGEARYSPTIDPADFLSPEEAAAHPNRYFPLVPGNAWHYVSPDETDDVTVTDQTEEILGVECFAVSDVVRENGAITENTTDFYAVAKDGTVWYFGEHSETIEDGVVTSLEGSWIAGEDGAQPGIVMEASPKVGDVYRQEFAPGTAEDMAEVLSLTGDEQVPAADCDGHCVVTRDFSPLEPGSEERKYYAVDVGLILEIDPETHQRNELTQFTPGSAAARPHATGPAAARVQLLSPLTVATRFGASARGAGSTIAFTLGRASDVNADVYDSAGRRVQSLFRGHRDSGPQTIEWRGQDTGGREVPNGIYFVRVRAGAESRSTRVAVLAR